MAYSPTDPNGATTATNSMPVAIATDQLSTLSTAVNQTTGNTSVASIDTKTPTIGQKTMAASRPVVLASDQSNVPVSGGQANAGSTSGSTTFTAADIVVPAPDGTGTLVSGTPTAGSVTSAFAVADGLVASVFLIKGLTASQTTITIYFEASANSTNGTDGDWVELKQRRTGTQPGIETADYKTQANGYFRGNCAGFKWLRARLIGTFTGTPSAQIWTSAGQGATFFNSGIPGGSSTIGGVNLVDTAGTNKATISAAGAVKTDGSAVTQPVSIAANTPTLQTGSNIIGKVGIDQTTPGTTNGVQVNAALPTGANTIGNVGVNANTSANALYTRETGAAATTGQISVGTTATVILAANTARKRLLIIQHGTTDVYIGGTGVTTTTGLLLKGVAGNQLLIKHAGAVSAIVASGTQTVSYIEETV